MQTSPVPSSIVLEAEPSLGLVAVSQPAECYFPELVVVEIAVAVAVVAPLAAPPAAALRQAGPHSPKTCSATLPNLPVVS